MICEYTITYSDFKTAQRLAMKRSLKLKLGFFVFQRLMSVLAVLALAALIWDIVYRHFGFPSWIGGLLGGVVWLGFYCPAVRPFQLRRLYRAMKNGRDDDAPVVLELLGRQMISRVPGLSEGRFSPEAVVGFLEDENVALIYLAKKRFLIVPKRAMPESDWQEIRNWIRLKGETTSQC